jgi:glycosyltransferase involved in cell wall biosynthesis
VFARRAERTLIGRGIQGLITQNAARAAIYQHERGSRLSPAIIENFKPRWNRPRSNHLKDLLGFGATARVVLYEGVLQRGRCLEALVHAAASFPADTFLVILGPDSPYARDTLRPLASSSASGRVHFLPGVPHEELLDLVSGADVGVIAYEKGTRNNLYCAPGKLSDYVHAGLPVIASDLPTLTPIIDGNGIGATFDNDSPASIAAAVEVVLSRSRLEWEGRIEAARQRLTWETQEPTVRQAILGLLRS